MRLVSLALVALACAALPDALSPQGAMAQRRFDEELPEEASAGPGARGRPSTAAQRRLLRSRSAGVLPHRLRCGWRVRELARRCPGDPRLRAEPALLRGRRQHRRPRALVAVVRRARRRPRPRLGTPR